MTERMKAYHDKWAGSDLAKACGDGIVIDSGEAWRYEYTHKDELGKYDLWYRTTDPLNPELMQSDMTLRDYFAGQALAGLIQAYATQAVSPTSSIREIASEAFVAADEMLEARKK